jgi:putative methyltransferase
VHARENEGVVAAVLPEAAARGFQLEEALPGWPRRGLAGLVEGAEKLLRVDPDEDGTDGFFVAVFAREDSGSGGDAQGQQQPQRQPKKKKKRRQEAAAQGDL